MAAKPASTNLQVEHEKQLAALSSVIAAILLTLMKLVVGLLTGSLGILSEAAHSGLDLVAAAVTFFAVRLSGKPADQVHTYGHGKVENLSALFETLLLLLTCLWIIYEAIQRLFFKQVLVDASIWAFLVMGVSIAVDFTRSRVLLRAAKKYQSQALEADGLHFSTDIWSSSVVIAGLFLVKLSEWLKISWLHKADAVAAIGVAFIVVYISLQLGKRTVADLLDSIPPGKRDELINAVRVPGVVDVKQVRVRRSGPDVFADVTATVPSDLSLEASHDVSMEIEEAADQVLPGIDVVVHTEPASEGEDQSTLEKIRSLAARFGMRAHAVRVYQVDGQRTAEMHLEVDESLSVDEAHQQATSFESALHEAIPSLERIMTHLEPMGEATVTQEATGADESQVRRVLEELEQERGEFCQPHDLKVQRVGKNLTVSFSCFMEAAASITAAHEMTVQIEDVLRARIPEIERVVVHIEPRN